MAHRRPQPRSRREAGAMMFLAAMALVMLVAFGALAVDGSQIYMMNAQCQQTADSAALAAAYMLPDLIAAEAAAIDYAEKNMPVSQHGHVIQADDIEFGTWDFSTRTFTPTSNPVDVNAVRVFTQRSTANGNALPLTLGNALGFQTTDINRSAVAAFGSLSIWDLSLAQDVTGSFEAEMDDAKEADQALLDCFAAGVDPRSTFGIVSFTGWGVTNSQMLEIGTSYNALTAAVDSIENCSDPGPPICSGTDIAVGLQYAINNLNNASSMTPGAPRAIVLVSDGKPETSNAGSHPSPAYTPTDLANLATAQANSAASQDISIFVVFYDQTTDPSQAAFLQTLVRGDGIFLSTPNSEDLPELLSSICGNLGPLRLVE